MAVPRASIRRALADVAARTFAFFSLLVATGGLLLASSVPARLADSASVRGEIERRMAGAVPGVGRVQVDALRITLAADAMVRVALSDVVIDMHGGRSQRFRSMVLGLRLKPLLTDRVEIATLLLQGGEVDLSALRPDPGTGDWRLAIAGLRTAPELARLHHSLGGLEERLRRNGLDSVEIRDVALAGTEHLGLRFAHARIGSLRLDLDARYTEGLTLGGSLALNGEAATLAGSWTAPTGEGSARTLTLALEGFDLSALPRLLAESRTPFEIAAPVDISANIPFDAAGRTDGIRAVARIGAGVVWFGDTTPTKLFSAKFDLRLDAERDSLAVLPSRIETEVARGTLEGGVRRTATGLDFEFALQDARSRAGNAARWQSGAVALGGALDAADNTLEFTRVEFSGEGGTLSGAGTFDLSRWTPGVNMRLHSARLSVETLKAFWPPFVAAPVRPWATGGAVAGGTLRDAALELDMPPGGFSALRKGRALGPGELSLALGIEGARLRTAGALPPVEGATGSLHMVGGSLTGVLAEGRMRSALGGEVDVSGSRLSVPDVLAAAMPARLELEARGSAADLLALSNTEPFSIASAIGTVPAAARGSAAVEADLSLPLRPRQIGAGRMPQGLDWKALVRLRDAGSAQPFKGRMVSHADLTVAVEPGVARIEGVATVDGLRTRLDLVEPFGTRRGPDVARRQVALRLDDEGRRSLGIHLPDLIEGPLDVRLSARADGWRTASVDVTAARLSLPFLNWRKGRGIPATARFAFRSRDGVIEVDGLQLEGPNFHAKGALVFDREGLRSANLPRVALASGDEFALVAKRRGEALRIVVDGARYDARSLLTHLLAGKEARSSPDKPSGRADAARYELDARFDSLRGFGDAPARDVRLSMSSVGGKATSLDLRAEAGGTVRATIGGPAGARRVRLDAANAGTLLRFAGIYAKMRGGSLNARLTRDERGTYSGTAVLREFLTVGEPKLEALIAGSAQDNRRASAKRVRIKELSAGVRYGDGALRVARGRLRGGDMAATFEGTVFDQADRMSLKGTFLPAYGLNRVVSAIPFLGLAAGNGRKRGFLGITFRLSGDWRSPRLALNPLSLFAPGVFRKIFE